MASPRDDRGNPVEWGSVRAAIFDVDGTLYFQPPVRRRMALRLAAHLLRHPGFARELWGIYWFRKVRETEAFRVRPLADQVAEAARRARLSDPEKLAAGIRRWMFQEPLPLIAENANREVLGWIAAIRAAGGRVLIYSDYAPEEKLAALGVKPDAVYAPGREGIAELKPSASAMAHILASEGLSPAEMVFVGDRPEKDGESAALVGMRYVRVTSAGA